MRKEMLAIVLMTLGLGLSLRSAPAAEPAAKDPHRGVYAQLQAAEFIANKYPNATTISLAVAVVPDPLVPRYRRPYDLSIAAIELGMLRDGFVLDRYSFPWSEQLQQNTGLTPTDTSSSAPDSAGSGVGADGSNRSAYGLMIFRCDAWRDERCVLPRPLDKPPTGEKTNMRLRALYVVTDTATQGVAVWQLSCAILKIQAQLGLSDQKEMSPIESRCPKPGKTASGAAPSPPIPPKISLLVYPKCPDAESNSMLVILGPNFSGAMESVGEVLTTLEIPRALEIPRVCLISSAATDTSNERVSKRYENIFYHRLALADASKLAHLAQLAEALEINSSSQSDSQGPHRDIAILAESSTFGYGVCNLPLPDTASEEQDMKIAQRFCDSAKQVYFPATIADIRYGLQKQQAQQSNDLTAAAQQVQNDQHLTLEAGAENGSEFPESMESSLTSASDQLQLDQMLDELTKVRPRMIVVVATDVRDRLFLFDQLRAKLPRAMLVDLEADNLLTHPDFLHASRGALAVASANLLVYDSMVFGCEFLDASAAGASQVESWSTDGQGILADTVARLYDHAGRESRPPCSLRNFPDPPPGYSRQAALQVVTLNGFRLVSNPFRPTPGTTTGDPKPQRPLPLPRLLEPAEIYAPIFCLVLPWIWLYPAILRKAQWPVRRRRRSTASLVASVPLAAVILLCIPMVVMAVVVAFTSSREASHGLMYCILATVLFGTWGLGVCCRPLRHASAAAPRLIYSNLWLAGFFAALAVVLAAAPILRQLRLDSHSQILDEMALTELGFDPTSGLGFFIALTLATIVVLAASAILGTAAWVVNRDMTLLARANADTPGAMRRIRRPVRALPVILGVVLFGLLVAPGFVDQLGGARLTVFGPFASEMALFALSATTLCAAILLCVAISIARQLCAICGYVRWRVLEYRTLAGTPPADAIPGLWDGGSDTPATFAATPVVARPAGGGSYARKLAAKANIKEWAGLLAQFLFHGKDDCHNRLALFVLLAAEMSLFRWVAAGTVLCALASVLVVYLYPIEADPLLLLNLLILVANSVFCAYMAAWFERDEVLSNILCNRSKKAQVSTAFFLFIAVPFIALAVAISVFAIPGVVDWAGGLLAMLRTLGVHP